MSCIRPAAPMHAARGNEFSRMAAGMRIVRTKNYFPRGFYSAYAKLVIEFGRLEYLIKLCIKDMHGQGFTQGMIEAESKRQFSALCRYAMELAADTLTSHETDAFEQIIEKAALLADYRNDSIHAYWTVEKGEPLRVRPKWDKKSRSINWDRDGPVSVLELRQKYQQTRNLWERLDAERKKWSVRSE